MWEKEWGRSAGKFFKVLTWLLSIFLICPWTGFTSLTFFLGNGRESCISRNKSLSLWSVPSSKEPDTVKCKLRILLKQNTALLSTVRVFVTGVTSHISHIYKGINAMLIIRGPIKPYIFWIKIILAIFLAKTRPDKTIFSALTNLTIDFDFELSKI